MLTRVTDKPLQPWQELETFQAQLPAGKYGATSVFIGTMRDFNQGDTVKEMVLEHYPEMTEKFLSTLCEEAASQWDIVDVLVVHRSGKILPNDTIVIIAAAAAHREAAFEACRYLIEELKQRAPFWKKETLQGEQRWVKKNTE